MTLTVSVDLSFLPAALRDCARVDGWEVSWPVEDAPAAIDALARNRLVVLGLELLDTDPDGQYVATPWAIFEPDPDAPIEVNVAAGRRAAQGALDQVGPDQRWVLVTWE